MKDRYMIITPVRNEEDYIEKTILSVVNQTITPIKYMVVNDGSTDNTGKIIKDYMKKYSWIDTIERPPKEHSPGKGVVEAFYDGYKSIGIEDWDYLIKLDADLEFEPDYFETLLKHFDKNPKLGISSGTTYENKGGQWKPDSMPADHVRGAAKMYRRACWDDIEGLELVLGWDTIDELKAQVKGWETKSFLDLVLKHYKPIGFKQKKIVKREIRAGERQHALGYLPSFALLRGVYRMLQKPYFTAGILNIYGFIAAGIQRSPRIVNEEIMMHLRNKQKKRLRLKKS